SQDFREADLPASLPTGLDRYFQSPALPSLLRHPFVLTVVWWYRIFNRLSITYASSASA
ncbi:hypothetical protein JDF658_26700, partial [Carboxydocella sp. JDF658]